jgi:hypothetical protein
MSSSGSFGSFSSRAGSGVEFSNGSGTFDVALDLPSSSSRSQKWVGEMMSNKEGSGAMAPQQQQQQLRQQERWRGLSGEGRRGEDDDGERRAESGVANVRRRGKGEREHAAANSESSIGGSGMSQLKASPNIAGSGGDGCNGTPEGGSSRWWHWGDTSGVAVATGAGSRGLIHALKVMLGMGDVRWREVHLLLLSYVIVALLVMLLLRA